MQLDPAHFKMTKHKWDYLELQTFSFENAFKPSYVLSPAFEPYQVN